MAMRRLPCVLMRGGTSRGPVFLTSDLPSDQAMRDAVLIAAMGSPNALQIDGVGGGNSLTSKDAIVGRSNHDGADIEYEFVQVLVDRKPNCGNMHAAAAPFAVESGLLPASDPETLVRVRNVNIGIIVHVIIQTPNYRVDYEGNATIDGVPGSASPVRMAVADVSGTATGQLFPAGGATTSIDDIHTTLIDGAIPLVIVSANDLGLAGNEEPFNIDANLPLLARLESVRLLAGRAMGLGDVTGQVIPKLAIVSAARHGGSLSVRYMTPDKCHRALAVSDAP